MAPVKFDDISKPATEVLNDDYQTSGYVFKSKQKVNWGGSVLTSQVDVWASDKCSTPVKLTLKTPKPFECDCVSVDKFEVDKSGKFKLEVSSGKVHPDLKVEAKSDLCEVSNVAIGGTYSGVKDLQVKFDTKATSPQSLVAEATYDFGNGAIGGLKVRAKTLVPDFGARYTSGPLFGALFVKDSFGALGAAAAYQVQPDLKCAATFDFPLKKGSPKFTLGGVYQNKYKAKIAQDQSLSVSAKRSLAKGVSMIYGGRYSYFDDSLSLGCQVSIE